MKRILYIGACSMIIALAATACERMDSTTETDIASTQPVEAVEHVVEEKKPVTVQEALREDAKLARTMGLEKFAQHMKSRQSYYQQFEEVSYEDDFVKIKMEDDELKVETPTGKAKFEEGESKIKTDTYKKKTETN